MTKPENPGRRLRVLHLTLTYNPVLTRYLEDMAHGFVRDERFDFDYAVLEGDRNPELESRMECPVQWLGMEHRQVEKPTLSGLFRLWRHIHQGNYDLVITHRHKPARMMAFIRPFLRLRGVISVWHDVGQFKRKGRALLAKWLMHRDWYHVGVSQAVSEDLGRTGPDPSNVVTIYNSVDIPVIRNRALPRDQARRELHIPDDRYLIGTIGQTAVRKGHRYLVEAMPAILEEIPDAHLVILGGGDQDANLQRQVESLGLGERITLTGKVREAFRYLPALDLYLMPSLREAFGISLIEAMALDLPVMGTRINGIPEVIGKEELLFEPASAEAIAGAVRWFTRLPEGERQRLRETTSRRVEELFSAERYQSEYLELAWKLAKRKEKKGSTPPSR